MIYEKYLSKKISSIYYLLIIMFYCTVALAQDAPTPITDFDGNTSFVEFEYAGPNPNDVDYQVIYETNNVECIFQGKTSRKIYWNFKQGQYCGWGVDLKNQGDFFDASGFKYLTFRAKGIKGNERFHIKIKDVKNNEPMLISNFYNSAISNWTEFSIPLKDFKNVDLTRLININLGFNITVSGRSGTIYIDDFKFE